MPDIAKLARSVRKRRIQYLKRKTYENALELQIAQRKHKLFLREALSVVS